MVIQRRLPVPVWGWSSPNENIIVIFNRQKKKTKADKNGNWRITLDPEPEGGPFDFSIHGKNRILFQDVLVGEVWLCSGQSNMEWQLKSVRDAEVETANASHPLIRHIKIPLTVSSIPNRISRL
jgi:sialate O-acetylesterase